MNNEESNENNPLISKIRKVLDLKIENDEELLDGLKFFSSYFNDNNVLSRRNLRSVIEKQGIEIRKGVLMECKNVLKQLEEINEVVKSMNENCMEMSNRLNKTKSETRNLIQQSTALQTESQKIELKRKVALSFVQQFQLTAEELEILQSDGPVDEKFLVSLDRLGEVEDHCRLLLRLPNQTAGVEGLENASTLVESAYERLYRWSQRCCRQMNGETCDIGLGLCTALSYLQKRPVLLKYVLDEFSTARRAACARSFIDALTNNRVGTPIEIHAHDPLRYTSDLLACLHQLTASEKEHLRSLLRKCNEMEAAELVSDCLDRICEGLCRPFKMRIEQLLVSEQDIVILYKINHLLQFYKLTLDQQFANAVDSNLSNTVKEIQLLSWRLFFSNLKTHSCSMLEKVDTPQHHLGPTGAIQNMLRLLEQLLTAQDGSMLPVTVANGNRNELQQVLYTIIDPLLQHCMLSASSLPPVEAAVYLCNCLYLCQTALAPFEYTDTKLEQIQGQLDANIDSLVSIQAGFVIRSSGLSVLYELLEQASNSESANPLNTSSNIDTDTDAGGLVLSDRVPESSVKKIMSQFDLFLAHPDTLLMPQLGLLSTIKVRDLIRRRSNDLVHSAYSRLYNVVRLPSSGYANPSVLMPRTPDQVANLILNC